jgi:hypothetical protein
MATGRWEMLPSTAYICMVPGNRIHNKTRRYLQSDRGGSCETAIFPLHCRLMRYRLGHKSDNGKEYGDKIGLRHTNQFTVNPGSGNGYITVRSR